MEFVWFIVVGLIAGWLAGLLVKGADSGLSVTSLSACWARCLGAFCSALWVHRAVAA